MLFSCAVLRKKSQGLPDGGGPLSYSLSILRIWIWFPFSPIITEIVTE